jgi:hypothetical protein
LANLQIFFHLNFLLSRVFSCVWTLHPKSLFQRKKIRTLCAREIYALSRAAWRRFLKLRPGKLAFQAKDFQWKNDNFSDRRDRVGAGNFPAKYAHALASNHIKSFLRYFAFQHMFPNVFLMYHLRQLPFPSQNVSPPHNLILLFLFLFSHRKRKSLKKVGQKFALIKRAFSCIFFFFLVKSSAN